MTFISVSDALIKLDFTGVIGAAWARSMTVQRSGERGRNRNPVRVPAKKRVLATRTALVQRRGKNETDADDDEEVSGITSNRSKSVQHSHNLYSGEARFVIFFLGFFLQAHLPP